MDKYGSENKGNEPHYLMANDYLSGMNIIFRRKLLEELGWFDPKYGMSENNIWYGEETILIMKAWKSNPNLKVFYDPRIFVYHLVPAHKMRILNILRIAFEKGKSQAYFWISENKYSFYRQRAPLSLIFSVLYLFYKLLPGILIRERNKYPFGQNYVVEKILEIVRTTGIQLRLAKDIHFPS